MCCTIGSHEWEDSQERSFSTLAFNQSCAGHINCFDNWFADTLHVDTNNVIYQNFHSLTQTSMEIGSLAVGGYGLLKGGIKLASIMRASQGAEILVGSALGDLQITARNSFLNTLESRINQLSGINEALDLNAMSKAGQVLDRSGLTRAGRALDKLDGRPNSVFPKATGNSMNKNLQGQFQLDDIITNPTGLIIRDSKYGIKIYAPDGRGLYFRSNWTFRGFIEVNYE